MPRVHRRLLAVLFVAGSAAWSGLASAQSAQDLATARKLAEQGGDLFDAGRYADAIERYQRAEAFFHAPTHVLMMARSYAAKGALVEAQEAYNKVARETLPPTAPAAFHSAKADAAKELEKLEARIPTLEVRLAGKAAPTARVEINGNALPPAAIGIARPVNPGEYTIAVSASGYVRQELKVAVKERERALKTIDLAPDGSAAPAVVPPPPTKPPTKPPATPNPAPTTPPATPPPVPTTAPKPEPPPDAAEVADARAAPGVFLIGLGATGVGAGAVALALGSSKTGDCPDGVCATRADQARYDNGSSLTTVGIGALVVGGVSGIVGTVLLLTAPAAPQKAGIEPWLGVGGAGVKGRF